MYPDLAGKRVVVTGGASGIGFATALRFVQEGSRVAIFDLDRAALERVRLELPAVELLVGTDVSDPLSVASAFNELDSSLGGIDILISNAGVSVRNNFADITFEQWEKVLRVNLAGMFLCAREASVRMRSGGVILMTASTNGMEGHPYYADYNASKAGVILLAKTMALEFAPLIRVNSVSPGYVLTPMQKAEYTPEMLDKVNERIPFRRHADPSEVAALFAFLASEQASYITGANIPIDGGETAGLQ
ncbi:MAG TPA: oxidoreductase [Synergistaceae bacterium]|jgi:NAD(P)-dependent dehydrogenase (short-subunit alcohol dehydrogenase family)|nr:MAG: Short-chain dehydrogenase/reductase SDR [Synergistales bacterium 57_84]KUK88894.1 MAG: Short-chain dehydrogenase/reductase SDR [Synergistales bacterium 58_81]HBG14131.1 oxidoreductase [Synergistaceae bacterium]HCP06955.1 oxidoreductase [Synergistaceae bacterium]HCR39199.1 oxidoreductase [Synergistaceae bacterium]